MKENKYSNILTKIKKAKKKGIGLVEITLGVGIMAVLVGTAVLLFQNANTGRKIAQLQTQLGVVQAAVRSAYSGQSTYSGLSEASLISQLPSSMVSGSNLVHIFGGSISVNPADAGGGTNSGFSVSISNIPQAACSPIASTDMGKAVYSELVSGSSTKTLGTSTPPPYTAAEANTACAASNGSNKTITWIFQ